jgi:hypothetical protein
VVCTVTVVAVFRTAIEIAVPITIFVAEAKTLAKIVVVGVLVNIITVITVVRVLIRKRVLIVGTPVILSVCFSGVETFRIPVVNGLLD